jgi:hypothetical protein
MRDKRSDDFKTLAFSRDIATALGMSQIIWDNMPFKPVPIVGGGLESSGGRSGEQEEGEGEALTV